MALERRLPPGARTGPLHLTNSPRHNLAEQLNYIPAWLVSGCPHSTKLLALWSPVHRPLGGSPPQMTTIGKDPTGDEKFLEAVARRSS